VQLQVQLLAQLEPLHTCSDMSYSGGCWWGMFLWSAGATAGVIASTTWTIAHTACRLEEPVGFELSLFHVFLVLLVLWHVRLRWLLMEHGSDRSGASCVYVCMYVCMCVCMYVYVHVCMFVFIYVFMYVCIYVCMYICMHVCMCLCIYVCLYVCICVYVCMYVCICVCMYVCMYVFMYLCIYVCMFVFMCVCVYLCMYVCVYLYAYMYACINAIVPGGTAATLAGLGSSRLEWQWPEGTTS